MKKAFLFALKQTYTIGISWLPIALAFGLLAQSEGFGFYWVGLSCLACPFGALQMIAFSLAASGAAWYTMLITAALSFRHLFYSLSFLERFQNFGAAKYYIIYMLCDEAYSVFCSMEVPAELNEKQVHLFASLLLQLFWLVPSTLFALLGSVIPVDLSGVEFALTALFTVILLEMLLSARSRLPAVCTGVCGLGCLAVFGADRFLIPALLLSSTALVLLRGHLDHPESEVSHDRRKPSFAVFTDHWGRNPTVPGTALSVVSAAGCSWGGALFEAGFASGHHDDPGALLLQGHQLHIPRRVASTAAGRGSHHRCSPLAAKHHAQHFLWHPLLYAPAAAFLST